MLFSADFLNLVLYCAQQLGITLGVGAETIMLAAYLISMRDGVVDEKETQYARAIKRVLNDALLLIVVSGLGIAAMHGFAGQIGTVLAPAFLFKWVLIVLAIALTGLRKVSSLSVIEGVIGGTWYALFLVHILAPVTTWGNLGTLYLVWLAGFVICWEAVVIMRRDKKSKPIKKIEAAAKAPMPPAVSTSKPPVVPIVVPVAPQAEAAKPSIVLGLNLHPITPQAAPLKKEDTVVAMVPPAPAAKVTDTPFLPKVAPLEPMPNAFGATPAPAIMTSPAEPAAVTAAPITTAPGSTSSLGMALNVMPKNPAELEEKTKQ